MAGEGRSISCRVFPGAGELSDDSCKPGCVPIGNPQKQRQNKEIKKKKFGFYFAMTSLSLEVMTSCFHQ